MLSHEQLLDRVEQMKRVLEGLDEEEREKVFWGAQGKRCLCTPEEADYWRGHNYCGNCEKPVVYWGF